MSYSELKVFHYYPIWLPQTQTWMYTLINEMNKYIDSHILSEKQSSCYEQFALPRIHLLSQLHHLRYPIEAKLRDARLLRQLPCMYSSLKKFQPSLIHSHFGNYGWINTKLTSKLKIPHIVSFYGADASLLPTINPSWIGRYRQLFTRCSCVLVEGSSMAKKIMALGCSDDKIRLQKIGVDLKKIRFSPRQWHSGEPVRILIAASFRPKKGIPAALKAISKLRKDIPVEIILIGDASQDKDSTIEKNKIIRILEDSGLSQITKRLGYIPYEEIFKISYNCHLFLHTSQTAPNGDDEGGAPVILTEMAASGIPIVATFHCDIPEIIEHEVTGFLAREADVDDIYNQMKKWIMSPESWATRLSAGRTHIEKNYNLEIQAKRLVDIYVNQCRQ